jgi:hypothetical protein
VKLPDKRQKTNPAVLSAFFTKTFLFQTGRTIQASIIINTVNEQVCCQKSTLNLRSKGKGGQM